ncbi:4-alpha-glucanotransferase [Halopelagius inordinatus]|uniref:4-alpha-glucanotransferase n=1 Tax=Halopelagius inordinatus TaxID=553467 RepID=A0A1I2UTC7_9EURY|nr:4-alpha-glucanotransferase [Halopelagius inordinatus]SFG80375.1 4-alpha-glucanotransferase [Halopelagius inordinatus]
MRFERQSGVFMHLTSLPGPHGVGDLGDGARTFVDWLDSAEQSLWQFCPLGPTSSVLGNSPYQSYSAFAGNPLLVSLERLRERGYLTDDDVEPVPDFSDHEVEYERVGDYKREKLRAAYDRFESEASDDEREAFERFRERESSWLSGYALFMSLRTRYDGAWVDWPQEIRTRDEATLERLREELSEEIAYREFVQFVFDRQWRDLKEYANDRGVRLVGDLPIYVALDSADVWTAPEAFDLTEENEPAVVAGVPPNPGDDGQSWGNPLYDWEYLRENDYDWWMDRLKRLFELVDVTRIDHFKGFDEYWAIPADEPPSAGEWRDGPGAEFFEAVERELGDLPFVVEDLGFLDQSVVSLRDRFDFPGMRVPQYAGWCEQGHMYQPMHYPENCVAYTSTHDTNTLVGYYEDLPDDQRDCLNYNIGADGSEIHWSMIDAVWRSNAVLAFTTMQDVLGLGAETRFNVPGTAEGNWRWRCTEDRFDADCANRLASLTDEHIRD